MSKNVSYIKDKTHNDNPIKVDMAVRDGQGKKIDETYFPIGGFDSTATVGTAEQLLLNKYVEDNEPFLYRTTGGSADVGDRMGFNSLVGGTIVFNQLVENGNFANADNWGSADANLTIENNKATITPTSSWGGIYQNCRVPVVVGHKYLLCAYITKTNANTNIVLQYGEDAETATQNSSTSKQFVYKIITATSTNDQYARVRDRSLELAAFDVENFMVIDLTLMLSPTIANYLYGLANNGGVAWFRKYFTKTYYEYTTAKMLSTRPVSKTNTGFNQWGGQWVLGILDNNGDLAQGSSYTRVVSSFIRVIPNQTYYRNTNIAWLYFYDENKSYISKLSTVDTTFTIPSNCAYLRFYTASSYGSTYNNDICINISHSGTHNGEFEPYEEYPYQLGSDILRGIWKLDSNNNLYFDGDTKTPDGTITRRYSIVDLGTLDWTYAGGFFRAQLSDVATFSATSLPNARTSKYIADTWAHLQSSGYFSISDTGLLGIFDSNYTDADTFKTAMSGVYLIYELATSTTEQGTAYDKLEIINDWGTENAVVNAYNESTQEDDNSIALPLGHDSYYYPNASDKLGNSPDLPSDTGYYVMHYESTGREATYTLLSTWLSANGYKNETDLKDTFGLKEALGGTLRQLLSVKASISISNTAWVDLGTLDFVDGSSSGSTHTISLLNVMTVNNTHLICSNCFNVYGSYSNFVNGTAPKIGNTSEALYLTSTDFANKTGAEIKALLKGVLLAYEKA